MYVSSHHQWHRNQSVQTELSWLTRHFPFESRFVNKNDRAIITER